MTKLNRIPEFPRRVKGRAAHVELPELVGSAEAQTTIREIARNKVKEKAGTHRCLLRVRRGAPGSGRVQQRRSGELGCHVVKAVEKMQQAKGAKARAARTARPGASRPRHSREP